MFRGVLAHHQGVQLCTTITLANDQLDAQFLYFIICFYVPLHVSSYVMLITGGQIVLIQHLVSGRPVHWTVTYRE